MLHNVRSIWRCGVSAILPVFPPAKKRGTENSMAKKEQSARSWRDIRAVLRKADNKEILKLVGELYALRKENQDFLHARYLKDASVLVPYKETIARYISPAEPWKNPIKISLARKAIADYRKAVGDSESLAELMLFYVECGVGYILDWEDVNAGVKVHHWPA